MKSNRLFDRVSDFFFPNRCPFCGGFIPFDRLCCEECLLNIEHADFCRRCGRIPCVCGKAEFLYDGCAVAIPYVSVGRQGILALKYSKGFNAAKLLVPELKRKLDAAGFLDGADIITAVPMTGKRRNETGYNHAEYIAKLLSAECGLPYDFRLIKKRGKTRQHDLAAAEREKAAKLAYYPAPRKELSGRTVIICDDIITTGSTLSSCAGVLKKMGAEKVYCAALSGTAIYESAKEKEWKNVDT